MTFSQVTLRLRAIKLEIRDLRALSFENIQDKITNLKDINTLLSEQNQLLLFRRDLLESNDDNIDDNMHHERETS